jgi:hypothetical protein
LPISLRQPRRRKPNPSNCLEVHGPGRQSGFTIGSALIALASGIVTLVNVFSSEREKLITVRGQIADEEERRAKTFQELADKLSLQVERDRTNAETLRKQSDDLSVENERSKAALALDRKSVADAKEDAILEAVRARVEILRKSYRTSVDSETISQLISLLRDEGRMENKGESYVSAMLTQGIKKHPKGRASVYCCLCSV